MVTNEFDSIVQAAGGAAGLAKMLKEMGHDKISCATVTAWYKSKNIHPGKKYHMDVLAIARRLGLRITRKSIITNE